ncbi:hypothetical protein FEE95_06365 [Maribacter algarum]|uniref:Uncharacterized protein n=1 Tax=Maribacter algarum (ex Zhang et al. 2020) TaxID=2578118 RepID=A0A5S3QMD7_9FLAO|nr:hypothetical protein [Maribacter algarum]TMM59054.1 hypothetical protein FEE95_06365 [Maribacter algarum]
MVFTNQELKNMAYRSANLGMLPQEDFILDEKKIINGYKTQKYGLNERIGELGESLSDHIRKMDIVKGQLSKEIVASNKSNTAAIEQELIHQKGLITHQKTDIKNHIRRCQLNGDTLESKYNVDEINSAEDFEPVKEQPKPKVKTKDGPKRIPIWLLYVIEVIFIFGEGVLFYNILTETHDLPEIILRSVFFIPIVFAASFLTSRKIPLRWVWLPTLLILSVYAILTFTVMEWFFESQALDVTLTFTDFFIKNGFLILGAVMMVTLALFLSNAVKSIYNRADAKVKVKKPIVEKIETIKEKSPQQMDLDLKFRELKGAFKRLKKLENQLIESHEIGKNEFKRILGDVTVLEQKANGVSEKIGECEKELSTLEINSFEELSKYREHFENYCDGNQIIQWKKFDFTEV